MKIHGRDCTLVLWWQWKIHATYQRTIHMSNNSYERCWWIFERHSRFHQFLEWFVGAGWHTSVHAPSCYFDITFERGLYNFGESHTTRKTTFETWILANRLFGHQMKICFWTMVVYVKIMLKMNLNLDMLKIVLIRHFELRLIVMRGILFLFIQLMKLPNLCGCKGTHWASFYFM